MSYNDDVFNNNNNMTKAEQLTQAIENLLDNKIKGALSGWWNVDVTYIPNFTDAQYKINISHNSFSGFDFCKNITAGKNLTEMMDDVEYLLGNSAISELFI